MIVGIGLDATRVARMERERSRQDGGFFDAVFTPKELAECKGSARELAIRFASKEAAAKALGTGLQGGVSWTDIEVLQESSGLRRIEWHGGALSRAAAVGVRAAWLSCGGDATIAVACVVLEG